MKIGVRAHDYGLDTPEGLLTRIANDGWETVQLAPRKAIRGAADCETLSATFVETVKSVLTEKKLTVAVLGAYVEPSLADETMRCACVKEFSAQMLVAKALNAGCIGTETTNIAKQPHVSRAEALCQLRRSLEEILPTAQRLDLTVAIEPVFYHTLATPELAKQILDEMKSEHLKIIFDPVNLFSPEDARNQESLWQRSFACFGDKIAAVHMKGIRLEKEQLCKASFAQSEIDYKKIFQLLKQAGRDVPILREEACPAEAMQDIAFLRELAR